MLVALPGPVLDRRLRRCADWGLSGRGVRRAISGSGWMGVRSRAFTREPNYELTNTTFKVKLGIPTCSVSSNVSKFSGALSSGAPAWCGSLRAEVDPTLPALGHASSSGVAETATTASGLRSSGSSSNRAQLVLLCGIRVSCALATGDTAKGAAGARFIQKLQQT